MTLPRFSLRLLLVAVAVLCAWLPWERSVVLEGGTGTHAAAYGSEVRLPAWKRSWGNLGVVALAALESRSP